MRATVLFGLFLIGSMANAMGGASTGGGGVIACEYNQTVEPYDHYEGRVLRHMTIDLGSAEIPYQEKLKAILKRLSAFDPARAGEYWARVKSFESETSFIPHITLVPIDDYNRVFVPVGCELKQAAAQQVPEFPGDPFYIVSKDLWDQMTNDGKAGLVLHEIIYRETRSAKQESSDRARYFNEKISSTSMDQMNHDSYVELRDLIGLSPGFLWQDPTLLWWYSGTDARMDCDTTATQLATRDQVLGAYPGLGAVLVSSGTLNPDYGISLGLEGGSSIALCFDKAVDSGEGCNPGGVLFVRRVCVSRTNPLPVN